MWRESLSHEHLNTRKMRRAFRELKKTPHSLVMRAVVLVVINSFFQCIYFKGENDE